jgi:hypothetical protein
MVGPDMTRAIASAFPQWPMLGRLWWIVGTGINRSVERAPPPLEMSLVKALHKKALHKNHIERPNEASRGFRKEFFH